MPVTRVVLGWQADGSEIDVVKQELPECNIDAIPSHQTLTRFECDPELLAEKAADADVLITWVVGADVYRRARRLKLLAYLHSGFDPVDLAALAAKRIALTNVAGANATAVAEHAFALLFALGKRIVERDARVKQGGWVPIWNDRTASVLLEGSTLVIVGMGEIGTRLARRARAFDMKVIGVRRSGLPAPDADITYGPSGLCDALAQGDFTALAVPHTVETQNLISHRELAAMKQGSFLINVARGRLVDEIALRKALDEGHLAGFASDVWWSYPHNLPEGWHYSVSSRLGVHLLPTVIASHDSAADIIAVKAQTIRQGAANVKAFLAGRTPPNLVFDGEKRVGSLAGIDHSAPLTWLP
jgi:phosphoglycerate dehydrogenase-like enzyme